MIPGGLFSSGVRDGDLLGATEGGARTVAVRCDSSCLVTDVAQGPAPAHGEGHLLVVADHPLPGATLPPAGDLGAAARTQSPLVRAGFAVLGSAGLLLVVLIRRRNRRRMS